MMTLLTLWVRGEPHRAVPAELAAAALLTQSGTSRAIARLGERGLLVSVPDTRDARARVIELTPIGLAVARDMVAGITAALREQLADAPDGFDLGAALRALVLLGAALDAADTHTSVHLGDAADDVAT